MSIKIAQINLTPGKKAKTASEIFISQPDSAKEALAGKLFILIEIENTKINSLKIIHFLIDKINYNYYQNEKILLKEKIASLKTEHIFESALAKTNKNFLEFIDNEKIRLSEIKINITAGIIHDDRLYIANTGKNKIFLIYEKKNFEKESAALAVEKKKISKNSDSAAKEYNITNLIKEEAGISKTKLFSNVISGKIPQKSFFFIANEALPEYISTKQLTNIISTLPPVSAVEQIKNTLSKVNQYVSFTGLIIKSVRPLDKHKAALPASTHDSITDLNKTEDETENLLTPSGIINLKKRFAISALFRKKKKNKINQETLVIKDKIYGKKKPFLLMKKIYQSLKNIFLYLINFFYYAFKTITNKDEIIKTLTTIKSNTKQKVSKAWSFLLNLNKKNKILLILFLLFLAVFAFNITRVKIKTEKENQEQSYNDIAALIEKKQNQAEANLLYSNEEGAKKLFTEISGLLESFPRETDEQKEKYSQFNEKYNLLLEKTRRVVRIDDAQELANLVNLNSNANPENLTILPAKERLYSSDSGDKSIYIMETKNNLVTTATDLKESITALKFPIIINENIYYFNNGGIIEFNTSEETMNSIKINLPGNNDDYSGADAYSNRLYLLNNNTNQIYRYNKNGASFSGAYSWVQEKINLKDAIDMSIDGHIYILKNTGEVLKLLRGQKIDFKLEEIDPPLKNPIKIYVSPDLKYIYILEKINNRLIIYDKTGQFILQYKSDKLADLKDFSVDEANKIIYFLNGASVYSVKATHFEE